MDAHIGRNKMKLRSKKWYMKLFYHMTDVAITNAWLLARRAGKLPKNSMSLWEFRLELARDLCASGRKRRSGRPNSHSIGPNFEKSKHSHASALPTTNIRQDEVAHWPMYIQERRMCRLPKCNAKTEVKCEKCNVFLCLSTKRNCFRAFHS